MSLLKSILFTPYALAPFATGILILIMGIFVFRCNRNAILNRSFFWFCLSVYLWTAGYSVLYASSGNNDLILRAARLGYMGVVFIPCTALHFIFEFLDLRGRKKFIILSYILSLTFVPIVWTNYFFDGVYYFFWGAYPKAGSLYMLFFIYFALAFSTCVFFLWRQLAYRKSMVSSISYNQTKYVFFGFFIATLSVVDYIPNYNIEIYPSGYICAFGWISFMSYAITRHKLMEIEVIIKKTLVFAGLFAMIMIVITFVTAFSQTIIGRYVVVPNRLSTLFSVILALALYDPSRKLLVYATDRFLFQRKENIQDILKKLSAKIITILELDKLAQTVLVELQSSLRVESGVILIKEEDSFVELDAFGLNRTKARFSREDELIQFCTKHDRILNLQDVSVKGKINRGVLEQMMQYKAAIVAPLIVHSELIGILFLGKKRSDQEYTNEELAYFPTIVSQIAVAISNGRLYNILKKSQINFAQQAKMAAIGTLSAGISHEIKNPLNHIKVGIAMLRMNKKHGLFDQMERYKMEEEVFKTLDILDENVTRANEVIERLSSFAKKPKEQIMEKVDIQSACMTALSFISNELEHNSIEVVKEIPGDFPAIRADLHTIEDIILNLIVNARHAIGHHGKITLKGIVENGHLDFVVSDTGQGIPKENLERIFDPFFTTKDVSRNPNKNAVKGSGLGLFIVREFIQRFGGNVEVTSEVGKGTEFHLVFPKEAWAA